MPSVRSLARWSLVLCLSSAPLASAQQKDTAARIAYAEGRDAYQSGKYPVALEKFRLSYTLSGEPALLYNISTTLQSMNRPGEAADTLEQYLRARPEDPQRAELEKRIADLRLSQSLADQQKKYEAAQQPLIAIAPGVGWMSDAEADRLVSGEKRRRKKLAIGLGVGLGTLAVGGIVVGVVCGLGYCTHGEAKDWDFGKTPVTK